MNNSLKIATLPLSLLTVAFLLVPPRAAAQQVQPAQKTGNDFGAGIYSPSVNRLSSPSILGPAGSYGGAFTITRQQNGAGLLNGTSSKLKISAERSLSRSAWSGGPGSISTQGASSWTAGGHAFGENEGSAWSAGARSFGMPAQAGGVWRSAPSSGFPSASSTGIGTSAALITGAIHPMSSPGSGSLPRASSFVRNGLAASSGRHGRSSWGSTRVLGSSLPSGIQGALAQPRQLAGPFGSSSSRTRGFGGRGTSTSQGLQSSHQAGSGALSNPLSSGNLNSNRQPNGGTGSNPDELQH